MGKTKMRVVLYFRVASTEQIDSFAMKAQSACLREQAGRKNLNIVVEVQSYEIGTALDRPGWHRALRLAAQTGADAILVKDYCRVARGSLLLAQAAAGLEQRGLQLISCAAEPPLLPSISRFIL